MFLMQLLKFYESLVEQYHTHTVYHNDIDTVFYWRIHTSLNLQFWNYPYYWHDIHKCKVCTVNKQQFTLLSVLQDDKPYVQEQFLEVSKP